MSKKLYLVFPLLLLIVVAVSVQPIPATARFALASWSFPDEYGQGIEGLEVFENSTASWQQVNGYFPYDETPVLDWNATVYMKIRCWTWFNSTLTGASSSTEGKLLQRHNVTVTDNLDIVVFSQQNFTYVSCNTGIDPPMWFYCYEVILGFSPQYGQYYTVTILYEVFW